jgi:hypothetical protein
MGVGHHVLQAGIVDLPGKPVTVLQPAAVVLLAAGDELVPHPVDLLLGLAVDVERDRLVELEMGAAVEGDEVLAFELEGDRHDRYGDHAADASPFLSPGALVRACGSC